MSGPNAPLTVGGEGTPRLSGVGIDETQEPETHLGISSSAISTVNESDDVSVEHWLLTLTCTQTRKDYEPYVRKAITALGQAPSKWTDIALTNHVMAYPTYARRRQAKFAILSFLKFSCGKIPVIRASIGTKPERKPIRPPTDGEMASLMNAIEGLDLGEQAVLQALIKSGHRARAIMSIPRDGLQKGLRGPILAFPPSTQKCQVWAYVPIDEPLYQLLTDYLGKHKHPLMFEGKSTKWLYLLVRKTAKAAGWETRAFCHLFRHLKAREMLRQGIKKEAIVSTMGWKDSQMLDTIYARIDPYDAAEEVRQKTKPAVYIMSEL